MKPLNKEPAMDIYYFHKAGTVAKVLNAHDDEWGYKVKAIGNMKAIIEVWDGQYKIGTM